MVAIGHGIVRESRFGNVPRIEMMRLLNTMEVFSYTRTEIGKSQGKLLNLNVQSRREIS